MGWLRSVGSIKLQVSFAEYCLFCRALLQKRPMILSILLTKATPYALSNTRMTLQSHVFCRCSVHRVHMILPCTHYARGVTQDIYSHTYTEKHWHTHTHIYRIHITFGGLFRVPKRVMHTHIHTLTRTHIRVQCTHYSRRTFSCTQRSTPDISRRLNCLRTAVGNPILLRNSILPPRAFSPQSESRQLKWLTLYEWVMSHVWMS